MLRVRCLPFVEHRVDLDTASAKPGDGPVEPVPVALARDSVAEEGVLTPRVADTIPADQEERTPRFHAERSYSTQQF